MPHTVDYLLNISLKNHYLYAEVAKAACTTIKYHLQKIEFSKTGYYKPKSVADVHNRWTAPFVMPMQLCDEALREAVAGPAFWRFAFVRNPYTRALSAYLDKIARNAIQKGPILAQLGRDPEDLEQEVTFREFLEALQKIPLKDMDIHFAPQWICTFADLIAFDFVGSFENIEPDLTLVIDKIAPADYKRQSKIGNRGGHATGTTEMMATLFGPAEISLAHDFYMRDFDVFGYSTDLADAHKPPNVDPARLQEFRASREGQSER